MKKIQMLKKKNLTFKDGCEKYLDDCRQRNLREGTIRHYKQSYTQFYKIIPPEMPLIEFTEKTYTDYVTYLTETLENDISINSYLRDLITTLHFLMREEYIPLFKMRAIKADKRPIETYTEEELTKLLKKPNMKRCSFTEYKNWVMTNFLFSTGVRQRSLQNIKIKDIDFDNKVVYVNFTKNRKPLIVPLNQTMVRILEEYLTYRQHTSAEEYLFCNVFGQKLTKSTSYHIFYSFSVFPISQKKATKKRGAMKSQCSFAPHAYMINNNICCGKHFTYTYYLHIYVYIIEVGYTVLRHKERFEILQRERELRRVFLTHFSFFF